MNIKACEYFMGDVAAVVRGLRDGGATEVVVCDGHGDQAVIPDLMVPGATYITGKPKPGPGALWGLDSSFAGFVLVGFHAMRGTPDGVLNHTQSVENRYWYNDVESGELAQNAAIAGYFGVPPILATGDEATCREATEVFWRELHNRCSKAWNRKRSGCTLSSWRRHIKHSMKVQRELWLQFHCANHIP